MAIPPRKGARIWRHGNHRNGPSHLRGENLRGIRAKGRAEWKRQSGCHRRSLAETAFFRLKTSFGERLSARKFSAQANEALIRCAALNKLTSLGTGPRATQSPHNDPSRFHALISRASNFATKPLGSPLSLEA